MAGRRRKKKLTPTLNVNLGIELRTLLDKAAKAENVSESGIVRRCLLGQESLRDGYGEEVETIVAKHGELWAKGK